MAGARDIVRSRGQYHGAQRSSESCGTIRTAQKQNRRQTFFLTSRETVPLSQRGSGVAVANALTRSTDDYRHRLPTLNAQITGRFRHDTIISTCRRRHDAADLHGRRGHYLRAGHVGEHRTHGTRPAAAADHHRPAAPTARASASRRPVTRSRNWTSRRRWSTRSPRCRSRSRS